MLRYSRSLAVSEERRDIVREERVGGCCTDGCVWTFGDPGGLQAGWRAPVSLGGVRLYPTAAQPC
jgi:hypothetical protein